jgi:hypothetical protein
MLKGFPFPPETWVAKEVMTFFAFSTSTLPLTVSEPEKNPVK